MITEGICLFLPMATEVNCSTVWWLGEKADETLYEGLKYDAEAAY